MASANQVSQLFVALYNRAIDGGTAQTYAGRAYNQGLISDILGLAPNMRTMTNQEFVELVYKNALGKDNNSDKAGIDHWVNAANENNWRREELTDNLLKSINAWAGQNVNTLGMTADQITLASNGATVFKTKVAISEKAATTIGGNADVYSLTFGSGLEDVTIGNYNTTQENNNKILQGIAARNPLAQSGGNTLTLDANGQTTFLPTDPNPPASGASKYVASTKFDDVIIGTVTAATDVDNPSSFTSETKIDAGEGYDTLKLNMSADFIRDAALGGSVTGIEKIELTNTTVNDNVTFNASGIRDVYTYVLNGSNGINLTNIAYNEYLLIEMNNVKSTGNTTTSSGANTVTNGGVTQITFDTTPTGGRLDLNFNNVGYDSTDNKISNHDILFGIGSGTAINPGASADDFANQAAGIGMLNIALSGSNYVDIVNNGVNRITVGGNGSLTTNLSQGVTYFNGANATGKLNVTALAPKDSGENGSNIFEYFATGSADDTVNIAVERLGQNATIDLGGGNDTLILSGQVDHEARKQFYNLNTVENLVFGALSGDALLIDLGTTYSNSNTPSDESGSNTSNQESNQSTPKDVPPIADRSANLQTITFEDGASVQLTSLGKKDLQVTYNGATDTQKVLVDTEGTVNLVLQGSDGGAAGTGKVGAGFVNLSNAKTVNVDLTGQGFTGYLSAGNATTLNINNLTGDKKLQLKANTLTEKNDLSSVETININTEAQDIDTTTSGSGFVRSVDLSTADLASLSKATLKGTGGIQFGELANKAGITIDGTKYSGRLETGNIYAGPGPLTITTKGAITTGNLTGNNITIDLSKNITTTDGLYNNNIGTIFVERANAADSTGTLIYNTGISGTSYSDGTTTNDTQDIIVNTNSANLALNGAGGVDKFNVEASSFTKSLTIKGNLGTVPDSQEAVNNYDTVRIDLSKTSGVTLDISELLVSNPNNEGIVITSSKGQDNITLVAGANHDVVEFSAGISAGTGSAAGVAEVYSVNLASLALARKQSFNIDGLTITNIGDTGTVRGAEIAKAIADYVNGTLSTAQQTQFSITGSLTSLTGDWAGASVAASGGSLNITANVLRNIQDLNMKFSGGDSTNAPTNITANITAGKAAGSASLTGTIETSPAVPAADAKVEPADATKTAYDYSTSLVASGDGTNTGSAQFKFAVDGANYTLTMTVAGTQTNAQTLDIDKLAGVLNGTDVSGSVTGLTDTTFVIAPTAAGTTITTNPLKDLGLTFAKNATTATNLEATVATTATASGAFTLGSGAAAVTWNLSPKTDAQPAEYAFKFVGVGTPEQAYQEAKAATEAADAKVEPADATKTAYDYSTSLVASGDGTNTGSAQFKFAVDGANYTLTMTVAGTQTNAQTLDIDKLAGVLNGTDVSGSVTGLTDTTFVIAPTAAGTTITTNPLKDLGLTFAKNATTATNLEATVATTATASGAFTLGSGAAAVTWNLSPATEATEAQEQIGSPAAVTPSVEGGLVWTGKALGAAVSGGEVFKISIAGNQYSVKADVSGGTTLQPQDVIDILSADAVSGTTATNSITYTINTTGTGNSSGLAPQSLKATLANLGIAVESKAGGIAGNQIGFSISDNSKLPADPASIIITPSTTFNGTNTAVTWTAQAAQGIAAQPDTSTISINGHTIVFDNVVLTAAQVQAAVWDLLNTGTLDSLSSADRAKVSIDGQTFDRANAKANKALFAIDGVEYVNTANGIELRLTDTTLSSSSNIELSQTNGNGDGSEQIYQLAGAHGDSYGEIVVGFNGLNAGQSYTFDGKTVIATKNLTANEVANAFALTSADNVNGAVIVGDFANIPQDDVLYYVASNSGTLTIQGTSAASIPSGIDPVISGTGVLGVNIAGVSAGTIQQGSDGSGSRADSYVTLTMVEAGKAAAGSADGVATSITANTGALDTINNFDVANDGVLLRKANGGYYGEGEVAANVNTSVIYVDNAGSTLNANVVSGVLNFSVVGNGNADAITLEQKLYVATNNIGDNKVAGFQHGADFYVVATGYNANSTTDDVVVKLAGVSGVQDITNVLA